MKPFGLIADTHNHNWTAFAALTADGVNSRLNEILNETVRCAVSVRKAGGDTIIHGGDLFHVRGSVAPSVLNPTLATYRELIKQGFKIIINAGNHDLEGKEATDLGSAITALREVGCTIINEPTYLEKEGLVLVPYINDVKGLKATLEKLQDETDAPNSQLIIHAGIDGVIKGLPDHGLSADYLSKLKFDQVFAAHYHNHKKLADNVWSIGALTHQTWSDVGSKAGFLVVSDEGVKWFASHAPSFIDIDERTDMANIPLLVDGNYVRAKVYSSKESEIAEFREMLVKAGAKGVNLICQPATGATRVASTIKAGASLEVSVQDYVKSADFGHKDKVGLICQDILTEARGS